METYTYDQIVNKMLDEGYGLDEANAIAIDAYHLAEDEAYTNETGWNHEITAKQLKIITSIGQKTLLIIETYTFDQIVNKMLDEGYGLDEANANAIDAYHLAGDEAYTNETGWNHEITEKQLKTITSIGHR